jgi:hypothetical protein
MTTTRKTSSIRLTPATQHQIDALTAAGFGQFTEIVRLAVDRMYREEIAHNGGDAPTDELQPCGVHPAT